MIEFLQHIDSQLLLALNAWHTPYMDSFMMLFTGRFEWAPMYAVLLFMILRGFGWRRGIVAVCCIVLAIACADQLCGHVIRPVVERLRPSNLLNPLSGIVHTVNGYRGGMYGFPSCHAANSFALAAIVTLMLCSRRAGWFIFIWAALNSYSRLYLGVHYPGDLLCGCVLGVLCGAACYGVFRLVSRGQSFENKRMGSAVSLADLLPLSGLAITVGIAVVALFAY